MAQQKQINIRLDRADLEKLDEILATLDNISFDQRKHVRRKYHKWQYTRQDAIVFLIRSYDLQLNASNYDPK
jgi:hypothetical protein